MASAGFGWRQGRQARIERDGNPQFVHSDPITGQETTIDLSELADLTPTEAKAYIAYFATHGFPPPTITDSIEPHPYLDANGQWRMSDTTEPVHNVDQDGEPTTLKVAPPPGVIPDVNGDPPDLRARIVCPDGTVRTDATHVIIVPNRAQGRAVRTATQQ